MERCEIASDHLRRIDGDERRLVALQAAQELSLALGHLHAAGVVHGDLHEHNVFVSRGVFKLGDLCASPRDRRRTEAVSDIPGWLRTRVPHDTREFVWYDLVSLTLFLVRVLGGKSVGPDDDEVRVKRLVEEVARPNDLLSDVIARMLGADPFTSAGAFRAALAAPEDRPADPPQPGPDMFSTLLLFLSANPDPQAPLNVEREENRINVVRNASKHQAHVRIECLPDVDLHEFARRLRLHRPTIVHFSGHGRNDGSLTMRDHNGATYDMDPRGLARLLAVQKATIRLVVLNACFSGELADLLISDLDCVIGMRDAVNDDAAILFAQAFYSALFDGNSVHDAFETSAAPVTARYHDEGDIPVLRTKAGVNPSELRLVR